MHFLKNKHIVLAMFVAPVLAIIAYFATDHIVSEKPHRALQGQSYKLVANPNCRYPSGQCTLQNGDLRVNVRVERITDSAVKLILRANMPVQNALASFADASTDPQPTTLYRAAGDDTSWNAEFNTVDAETSTLRLALEIADAIFFAETPTLFIDYETTFSRENFSK